MDCPTDGPISMISIICTGQWVRVTVASMVDTVSSFGNICLGGILTSDDFCNDVLAATSNIC